MRVFTRLLSFLRPYRAAVVWSVVLAALGDGRDGRDPLPQRPRDRRDRTTTTAASSLTLALLVAGAGLVRLALSAARRLIAGRVSLGVEYDLRTLLFGRLQSLELAFFDRQQTGQLMSRATVDLQSVRFFLGYGLVFMVQSGLAIALAAVAMFAIRPELAAIALAPVPFVVYVTYRYSRLARPALQEVQQRIGELTADVEENIAGVRVVKAFAREAHQRARFERTRRRASSASRWSRRGCRPATTR